MKKEFFSISLGVAIFMLGCQESEYNESVSPGIGECTMIEVGVETKLDIVFFIIVGKNGSGNVASKQRWNVEGVLQGPEHLC